MKLKVENLLGIVSPDANHRYSENFRHGDVELGSFETPDVLLLFMSGSLSGGDCFMPVNGGFGTLLMSDMPAVKTLIERLETIPRVFYCEFVDACPDFIKDEDIILSHDFLPTHPNTVTIPGLCDDSKFYPDPNVKREKGTVAIMADHSEYLYLISRLECVSKVVVLGVNTLEDVYGYKDLIRYKDKIKVKRIPPQDAGQMREVLSGVEYVMGTQNTRGLEVLSIEGLLCGAQPVIIDNGHYRENIYKDLDYIRYFDPESPYETIEGALTKPSVIDSEKIAVGVERFSSRNHIPDFWEMVKGKIGFQNS